MIVATWGYEKSGKSTLSLTFPKPIYHFDLDVGGFDRAIWRLDKKDITSKSYPTPLQIEKLMGIQKEGVTIRIPKKIIGIKELWQQVVVDFVAACQNEDMRTIIMDSGTQLWSLGHTALLQEKQEEQIAKGAKEADLRTSLLSIEYGPANDRMKSIIFCLHPLTRILKADLTWAPIKDIKVGDELIGIDEYQTRHRKLRRSIVEDTFRVIDEAYVISLEGNQIVIANGKHPWLRKGRQSTTWVRTDELLPGDKLKYLCPPWDYDSSREAGYLAAAFDGEGSVCEAAINFTQSPGVMLDTVFSMLRAKEYQFGGRNDFVSSSPLSTGSIIGRVTLSGIANQLRFLGSIRPVRLLPKAPIIWEGHQPTDWREVAFVLKTGPTELVNLQTSTNTFIAEGLITHNTARSFSKNLVLNHYPKDIYAPRLVGDRVEEAKTGEIDIDGFKQTKALVDIAVFTTFKDGKYTARVTLSGIGPITGLELEDPTYDKLKKAIDMSRGVA